jgi:hypothetical protein
MTRKSSATYSIAGSVLVCSVLALSGCAVVPQGLSDYDSGLRSRGTASWYGQEFHGRLTASGEIYDQNKFTAAHRLLPLGARVRVLNVLNGRYVDVIINDRGPFVEGRIIDLSYGAAEKLNIIDAGTSSVLLDVITDEDAKFLEVEWRDGGEWIFSTAGRFGAVSLATKWRGSVRDTWFVPAGADESLVSRRPLADLRAERRSRRLTDVYDELPQPTPPSGSPLPEEYSGYEGDDRVDISV